MLQCKGKRVCRRAEQNRRDGGKQPVFFVFGLKRVCECELKRVRRSVAVFQKPGKHPLNQINGKLIADWVSHAQGSAIQRSGQFLPQTWQIQGNHCRYLFCITAAFRGIHAQRASGKRQISRAGPAGRKNQEFKPFFRCNQKFG